jgi:hypothetical protein
MTQYLYAWTTMLPDGRPSIIGTLIDGKHTPLIVADVAIAAGLRVVARKHAETTGQTVTLVRFGNSKVMETLKP